VRTPNFGGQRLALVIENTRLTPRLPPSSRRSNSGADAVLQKKIAFYPTQIIFRAEIKGPRRGGVTRVPAVRVEVPVPRSFVTLLPTRPVGSNVAQH
jgi:hypothetical protein